MKFKAFLLKYDIYVNIAHPYVYYIVFAPKL